MDKCSMIKSSKVKLLWNKSKKTLDNRQQTCYNVFRNQERGNKNENDKTRSDRERGSHQLDRGLSQGGFWNDCLSNHPGQSRYKHSLFIWSGGSQVRDHRETGNNVLCVTGESQEPVESTRADLFHRYV